MATTKKLNGTWHAHGCSRCKTRYEDSCQTPEKDALCADCRSPGSGWTMLIENRSPKDCCFALSRVATKEELARYRLAGQSAWWICRACARTHPFQPKEAQK
jgi:hypothetical protein